MYFDRESTVVITKVNNLSESVLTNYCQKFGKVVRCFLKPANLTRNKEAYALIKFAEISSVSSILSNRNHTINGTHVVVRAYHQDSTPSNSAQSNLPSLMSCSPNRPKSTNYDQLLKENQSMKSEIAKLQQALAEAQLYSKTAYETFQALREKFEAEQVLTSKLKSDYDTMVQSYECQLKQSDKLIVKDKVKEEPIDCQSVMNYSVEIQVMKDRLEQAQIDLGKCQTVNAVLKAKLLVRDQQFDERYKELNSKYSRMKKDYEHVHSCVKEFYSKIYPNESIKTESDKIDPSDSNDDIIEIIMQVDPPAT